MLDLDTIPKFRTSTITHRYNPMFQFLQDTIKDYEESYDFQMNPDFQRGHVWTKQQQIDYIEFILKGGSSGLTIYFNCPAFDVHNKIQGDIPKRQMVIVDGLQRLTAMLKFLNNELPVFGTYMRKDLTRIPFIQLTFATNALHNKVDLLDWYLELNTSGTPHTTEELRRVQEMRNNLIKGDNNV